MQKGPKNIEGNDEDNTFLGKMHEKVHSYLRDTAESKDVGDNIDSLRSAIKSGVELIKEIGNKDDGTISGINTLMSVYDSSEKDAGAFRGLLEITRNDVYASLEYSFERHESIDDVVEALIQGSELVEDEGEMGLEIDLNNILHYSDSSIRQALLRYIAAYKKDVGEEFDIEFIRIKGVNFTPGKESADPDSADKGRLINDLISDNYPIFSVLRINNGDKILNVIMKGIKAINDKYGQLFTDSIIKRFTERLTEKFDDFYLGEDKRGKVIRRSYKNITFSTYSKGKTGDIETMLFGNERIKRVIMAELFESIEMTIKQCATINGISQEELKDYLMSTFDFGLGFSEYEGGESELNVTSIKQKLLTYHHAEIRSRQSTSGEKIEAKSFDAEAVKDLARKALELEQIIINENSNEKFIVGGASYDVITEGQINRVLLRNVRKGKNVSPEAINTLVGNYLNYLNDGFDFISPFIGERSFKEVVDINEDLNNNKIRLSSLERNFKGTLTKEALFEKTRGRKGMRLFIDIKDMGLLNLDSFKKIAEEINKPGFDENRLLESGIEVTKSFIDTVKAIEGLYENAEISLGGDEMFIFIPEIEEKQSGEVLSSINESMMNNGLEGRMTYSFDVRKSSMLFAELEQSTGVNKFFEEGLGHKIADMELKVDVVPECLSVNIESNIAQKYPQVYQSLIDGDYMKNIFNTDDIYEIIARLGGSQKLIKFEKEILGNNVMFDVIIDGSLININIKLLNNTEDVNK